MGSAMGAGILRWGALKPAWHGVFQRGKAEGKAGRALQEWQV